MYYSGDKIRFIYTGDVAEVRSVNPDGSYMVWLLADKEMVPAFEEDFVLEQFFTGIVKPAMEKKKKQPKEKPLKNNVSTADLYYSQEELDALEAKYDTDGKAAKKIEKEIDTAKIRQVQSPTPSDSGIRLLITDLENDEFSVFVVNDTNFGFSFRLEASINTQKVIDFQGRIERYDFFPAAPLSRAALIHGVEFIFESKALGFIKEIKLKPKNFIQKTKPAPLCHIDGLDFLITEKIQKDKTEQSLSDYTKQHTAKAVNPFDDEDQLFDIHNVHKRATFETSLDLHIERLHPDPSSLIPYETLKLQLDEFRTWLEKAIEIGISPIYVVHGVGSGRLRNEIHKILAGNRSVVSFKNEYLEKYGYGATEILL